MAQIAAKKYLDVPSKTCAETNFATRFIAQSVKGPPKLHKQKHEGESPPKKDLTDLVSTVKPSIAKFCNEFISFYKLGSQKENIAKETDYREENKSDVKTQSRTKTTASFKTVSREENFERKLRLI